MPEAKSSVSYSLQSKGGFPFIFTVRETDESKLLDLMDELEVGFVTRGFSPERKIVGGFQPKPAPVPTGEKCPTCGADLIKFTSKDGTKSGVKCSTAKYDWATKTASGCQFVRWNDADTSVDGFATQAQIDLLTAKGLYKTGMTKAQANAVIGAELAK